MGRTYYVFVNYETKDIVSTSSFPGKEITGWGKDEPGPRALDLFEKGYFCYGHYHAVNGTIIQKWS